MKILINSQESGSKIIRIKELETERKARQAEAESFSAMRLVSVDCAALLQFMSQLKALLLPILSFLCKITNLDMTYHLSELDTP